MSAGDAEKPALALGEGFGLYAGLLDEMAALRAGGARDPFADAGFRPGPDFYTDIAWRPKSEEGQHFAERVEPADDLALPRCAITKDTVELVLRHSAGAVGKRLVVILDGRRSAAIRPEPPEAGAASRDVALSVPVEAAGGGVIRFEIVQEQRLVFSRAYRTSDGAPVAGEQPPPQIIEFRRFDGKALHLGVKRMEGGDPPPRLDLRFSFDGTERSGVAELDASALKPDSIQNLYRLPIAELIAPSRLHEVTLLGDGPADKIRKGAFGVISVGRDHFWLSRPALTPDGVAVTIVRDDAKRGGVTAALSDGAGGETIGRSAPDPADFRFRKGDNSFAFPTSVAVEGRGALHVRDAGGAPLFDVKL